MNDLVSVIVPIYNVEKYLEKCIKSILNQTYSNIEIILVNDGSTDNSEKIILKYKNIDKRIIYYKKTNGGLASARNYGIKHAHGKFISFVDSDDYIEKEFIEKLLFRITVDKSDIAICNIRYVYSDGKLRSRTPKIEDDLVVSKKEAISDLFCGKKFKFHAVNKLYRIHLFKDNYINYTEGVMYEDVFTTYKLFEHANKVSYLNYDGYNYLQSREGSILYSKFNEKRFVIFEALEAMKQIKNRYNLDDQYQQLIISNVISIYNYLIDCYENMTKIEQKEYLNNIKKNLNTFDFTGYYKNNYVPSIDKIRFFLINNVFFIYKIIVKAIRS